jgi:hypothetical protein
LFSCCAAENANENVKTSLIVSGAFSFDASCGLDSGSDADAYSYYDCCSDCCYDCCYDCDCDSISFSASSC